MVKHIVAGELHTTARHVFRELRTLCPEKSVYVIVLGSVIHRSRKEVTQVVISC